MSEEKKTTQLSPEEEKRIIAEKNAKAAADKAAKK